MDGTEKVITGLIICAIVLGGAFYLADKFKVVEMNKPATYKYSNGDSEFEVNRVSFERYTGYQIKYFYEDNPQPYFVNLRYDPLNLEDIDIDRTIFHKIKDDKVVYITINPFANLTARTTLAALELDKFIDNKYFLNIAVNSSMTQPYGGYPVKTCDDATKDSSVVWLRKGDNNQITSEGDCVIVEGKTEDDIIRGADRLALYLVGIMP